MPQVSELGEAIRKHRGRYTLTQGEIADAMNVSRAWIAGIETAKGQGRPDPLFVARAANYLRIGRREAFQMAGYTAGEVLELFGDDQGASTAEPVSELRQVSAQLQDVLREARATAEAIRESPERISPDVLRAFLEQALSEGLLVVPETLTNKAASRRRVPATG